MAGLYSFIGDQRCLRPSVSKVALLEQRIWQANSQAQERKEGNDKENVFKCDAASHIFFCDLVGNVSENVEGRQVNRRTVGLRFKICLAIKMKLLGYVADNKTHRYVVKINCNCMGVHNVSHNSGTGRGFNRRTNQPTHHSSRRTLTGFTTPRYLGLRVSGKLRLVLQAMFFPPKLTVRPGKVPHWDYES